MTSSPSSTTESAKARSSRASGSASAVTRSIKTMESATSPIPASMVGPIPTADLDVAVDPELLDDAMQRHRNDDGLEDEGDCRGHVKVRRVLDEGLPGDGKREDQGVQCKDVEQRIEPILVQHHEADQDETACQRMRDVKGEAVHLHQKLFDTKSRRVPRRPSMSAAPRNCGTRKTRIFAVAVSNSASEKPATASLTT